MTHTVHVSTDHIGKAKELLCLKCPVELAMADIFGKDCWCGRQRCGIIGEPTEWYLPSEARSFVSGFDERKPVKPFSFKLTDKDKVNA